MAPPIRGVLLDMDGVLAEVKLSFRQCILQTAAHFGVEITGADVTEEKTKGNANNDWVLTQRMVAARGGSATLEEVTEKFEELYAELSKLETLIPPRGVVEELYRRCEGRMAIVTGRPREQCDIFLDRFDLQCFMKHSVCMEDGPPKPDPNPIHLACKALGIAPEEAIMIGDTPDDVKAAVAAGARGIGTLLPDDHARLTLSGEHHDTVAVVKSMSDAGAECIIRPGLADLLDIMPTL